VAVFGATGRIGSATVKQLLQLPSTEVAQVRAVVRDAEKASEMFSEAAADNVLDVAVCDLRDDASVAKACAGMDVVLWCVSGQDEKLTPMQLFKGLFGLNKKDRTPVDRICAALKRSDAKSAEESISKVVVLSSAAVTRLAWSAAKKKVLNTVVDIPIVRLNPLGTLDRQRELEQRVRESGLRYTVVRPVGLKTAPDWPAGRPVLSQGDVAVGRVNIDDVAKVLVSAAQSPQADGATFEVVTLQGYLSPLDNFETVFSRLRTDEEREAMGEDMGFGETNGDSPGEAAVLAEFKLMMQLLPGEIQDPTRLEMGKTYEQLDRGEVDRKKGAPPTKREKALADGVRN